MDKLKHYLCTNSYAVLQIQLFTVFAINCNTKLMSFAICEDVEGVMKINVIQIYNDFNIIPHQ